jgi:hypothetical protein
MVECLRCKSVMVEGQSSVRVKKGKPAVGRVGSTIQRLKLDAGLNAYICENCGYVELHAPRV